MLGMLCGLLGLLGDLLGMCLDRQATHAALPSPFVPSHSSQLCAYNTQRRRPSNRISPPLLSIHTRMATACRFSFS